MAPETKKTINSFLMAGCITVFSILIGMVYSTKQDMKDVIISNNLLVTKVAERIIISDNAIAANNVSHCNFEKCLDNHNERIEILEKDYVIIKTKLEGTKIIKFPKD